MNQPQSIALFFPEIRELLREKNYTLLKQLLKACSPLDFADVWNKFAEEERLQIFKLLPANSALKLFEILDISDQRLLLAKLNDENVSPLLDNIDSPDLAKIFHKMSPRAVKKMTGMIKRQEALAHIDQLMQYPEKTAGSLMHPEFVKLSPKMTARQALLCLQAITRPGQKEHLYSLFVTDEQQGKVMGALSLQDLVSAPPDEQLYEMMSSVEQIKVRPETDQEEVSKLFSKYQITSAPVVDEENRLIGVLTLGDILSVVRQEATEDIVKMAGTQASELEENSVFKILRIRMPWLMLTLFGGIVLSFIIKSFEPILAKVIALASFSPLIAGMGGNVGSQSATIVVRSIALGQMDGHRMRAVLREMKVGLMMGICYGALLGALAYLIYGRVYHGQFALVVSVAMCTSMVVASTIGSVGPILFHRMGIDPATASGPLITTITDMISNITYFTLATLLLTQL